MTTLQHEVPPEHPAMFAALAVPNFRRYVSGQSLSLIGTWVETVAQALLVLRLTHSGTILGLTTAARYAPILLLSRCSASTHGACTRSRPCHASAASYARVCVTRPACRRLSARC